MNKNIGGLAGPIAALAYLAASALLLWGILVNDPNRDDEGMNAALPYVVWTILVLTGTIGAAVVVYGARKKSKVTGSLAKVAVGVAVLAAITSFMAWAIWVWGLLLSVAFLLLALALRRNGVGVTGRPSAWDWAIPVALPLAIVVALGLPATGILGGTAAERADVAFTIGGMAMMVLIALTLVQAGRWLGSNESVSEEVSALAS